MRGSMGTPDTMSRATHSYMATADGWNVTVNVADELGARLPVAGSMV